MNFSYWYSHLPSKCVFCIHREIHGVARVTMTFLEVLGWWNTCSSWIGVSVWGENVSVSGHLNKAGMKGILYPREACNQNWPWHFFCKLVQHTQKPLCCAAAFITSREKVKTTLKVPGWWRPKARNCDPEICLAMGAASQAHNSPWLGAALQMWLSIQG